MVKSLDNIEIAQSFISKVLGLVGRKDFRGHNGMLLMGANSTHTFFVRFPIDVVFLDRNYKVLNIVEDLKPFWFGPIGLKLRGLIAHGASIFSGGFERHLRHLSFT